MTNPITTSSIDLLKSYTATERDGVVVEVRTSVYPSTSGRGTSPAGMTTWALAHGDVPSGNLTVGSTVLPLATRTVVFSDGTPRVDVVWSLEQPSGTIIPDEPTLAAPIVSLDFDNATVQTNKDRLGTVIEVTFGSRTKGAVVDKMEPVLRKTVEYVTATTAPTALIQLFAGRTNDALWTGGAAGTWLCEGGGYTLEDSSVTPPKYRVRFNFVYNPSGWNPTAVYIDDETGQPPANLVDGTGIKTVDLYAQATFVGFPGT